MPVCTIYKREENEWVPSDDLTPRVIKKTRVWVSLTPKSWLSLPCWNTKEGKVMRYGNEKYLLVIEGEQV